MAAPMDIYKSISNILAVRLSGIGDVVLLLPALAELKTSFGNPTVTLVTGSQCAPVARLCPYIDEVVPIDRKALKKEPKLKAAAEIWRLVREVRRSRFDLAVDFHSLSETNLLVWFSRAHYRMGLKRSMRGYLSFCFNLEPAVQDETLHIAAMFRRAAENVPGVVPGLMGPGPLISPPDAARAVAAQLRPPGPCVSLNVGASRPPRRWPASRFARLASFVTDQLGAAVMVLGGASDEEESLAREVWEGTGRSERVHLVNGLSFPEIVAVIERTDLLVSNDTGPMHVGPALGTPTIGLFGGGAPEHYRPSGPLDRYVAGVSMDAIAVDSVVQTVREVWAELDGSRAS
jgi:heptosyltransferase-1